jgi:hypothetical protein
MATMRVCSFSRLVSELSAWDVRSMATSWEL